MSRLQEIHVENFKSYRGFQRLGPLTDFTCVIGPNGAGKSNFMDAISFVLGIQSQSLRSHQLRELIYRSASMRTEEDGEDGESGDGEQQPTSAYVAAHYQRASGQNVVLKRVIRMNGTSEYRLDDRVVSFADYTKFLEQENILVKARNFLVFQGDVEQIASQSAKDLTKLIEQISGSIEWKDEYEKLKADQERATENSTFNFNKKRGINAEIKQYREQRDEAIRFEKMQEERDSLIVKHVLWRLFHIQKDMEVLNKHLEREKEKLSGAIGEQQQLVQQVEEARKTQARHQKDRLKLEKTLQDCRRDLDKKSPELVKIEEQLKHAEKRIQLHTDGKAKAEKELARQQASLDSLRDQLKSVVKTEALFEESVLKQKKHAKIVLSDAQMSEYTKLRAAADSELLNEKQESVTMERQIGLEEENEKRSLEKMNESSQHHTNLIRDRDRYLDNKEQIENSLKRAEEDLRSKRAELDSLVLEKQSNLQKEKETEERLTEVYKKLTQARYDRRETEKQARMKEALESMKRMFPGVHGRLIDLCRPSQKKYDTAISILLSKYLDAIVVESDSTAIECIKYLKDQQIGLATFLPLESLQVKPINEKYRVFCKGARLAVDLIQFDPVMEKAIHYACGNAIICDDLNVARHICFEKQQKVKAITLDGTVIHKAGLITGGRGESSSAGRWEERELDQLRKLKDRLEAELNDLSSEKRKFNVEEQLKSSIQSLESRRQALVDDLSAVTRKLASIEEEIKHSSTQSQTDEKAHDAVLAKLKEIRARYDELSEKVDSVEDKIFSGFCRQLKLKSIREYEGDQLKVSQEQSEKRMQFTTHKSKLQNEINFMEGHLESLKTRCTKLESTLTSEMEALEKIQKEKTKYLSTRESTESKVADISAQIMAIKATEEEAVSAVNTLKRKLQEFVRETDRQAKENSSKEALVEKLFVERFDIYRKCKLEEIALPLIEGSLDDVLIDETETIDVFKNSMDVDRPRSSKTTKSRRELVIEVDFADLEDDLKDDPSDVVEHKFEERIKGITADLENMAPNMKAVERLDGVENRLKTTAQEFEAARREAKQLKDKFNAVKQRRYNAFYKAFSHISQKIDHIYKELTRGSTHPLGGTAYLTLANTEEPYLDGVKYHAMPPMKTFRDMEQLSGGEKTIAALALLFAIHSYQPSPFFVLDEVDAALDNANVAKIAQYIKKHANENFQFVVISLKSALYEKAQTLAGVYRDQEQKSSRVLTLDLTKYSD